MRTIVFILVLFISNLCRAQLAESFSDNDFTTNPAWVGSTASWQVIANSDVAAGAEGSRTLRLNAPSRSGVDYLSTQVRGNWGLQQSWSFWLGRRGQVSTSQNVSFFWLYASESNVATAAVNGYRVRFGDNLPSGDRIVLESIRDGNASPIINSEEFVNQDLTDFGFMVRVTRTAAGLWTMYTSDLPAASGSGAIASDIPSDMNANVFQGSVINNTYTVFDNGWLSVSSLHTGGALAREGCEFDQISFSGGKGVVLPLRWDDCSLEETDEGIRLSWTNHTETEILYYRPERSVDGQNFTPLVFVHPLKNDGGVAAYQYHDVRGNGVTAFYRIAVKSNSGSTSYSPVLRTAQVPTERCLELYPSPVCDGHFQLSAKLPKAVYSLSICNQAGQAVYVKRLVHGGGRLMQSIEMPPLARGIYYLMLNGPVLIRKDFFSQ